MPTTLIHTLPLSKWFTSIQMVYNQALLNNLYHDIKKYKDIKVLVEGGKEAQTYEFIMSVHGMKRRFT